MRGGGRGQRGAVRPLMVVSVAVSLVMLAFIAGYFLGKSHGWEAAEQSHKTGLIGTVAPSAPPTRSPGGGDNLDFYDTLPQTTVPSVAPKAPPATAAKEEEGAARPESTAATTPTPTPVREEDGIAGLIEQKNTYAVQVGSFLEESEAQALKAKLDPLGEPVAIQRREQNDGSVWYRVQVGEYPDRGQAQKMADHIELLFQSHPLVVLR